VFSGPLSSSTSAKVPRYAFNDQAPSSDSNKNYWTSPVHSGNIGTKIFNHTAGSSSAFVFAMGAPKLLTVNSVTPNVAGYEFWYTSNTAPTTITDFPGGVNGQVLEIICTDANTTLQHNGAGFVLPGIGNMKLRNGSTYRFMKNGPWKPVSENPAFALNVSADNGDAAKTLQSHMSETTQVWGTPLTTARAITLSTTGATAGVKFRIVRKASATGAFNLDVDTGPLKALTAAGQWCDVEYDGSAWILTAYGAL